MTPLACDDDMSVSLGSCCVINHKTQANVYICIAPCITNSFVCSSSLSLSKTKGFSTLSLVDWSIHLINGEGSWVTELKKINYSEISRAVRRSKKLPRIVADIRKWNAGHDVEATRVAVICFVDHRHTSKKEREQIKRLAPPAPTF